jgi:hypothetical protein
MNICTVSMATLVRQASALAISTARGLLKRAMKVRASRKPRGT